MKIHETFNEMYEDDEFLSPEKRAEIDFEVSIIGKMIENIYLGGKKYAIRTN